MAPVIKEKPKIVKVVKERIVVECLVFAATRPSVTWFKETTAIKESSQYAVQIEEVTKGQYSVALEISKPTKDNKGQYKLVATNEKGEVSSQAVQVDVDGN